MAEKPCQGLATLYWRRSLESLPLCQSRLVIESSAALLTSLLFFPPPLPPPPSYKEMRMTEEYTVLYNIKDKMKKASMYVNITWISLISTLFGALTVQDDSATFPLQWQPMTDNVGEYVE